LKLPLAAVGLLLGLGLALAFGACCPESKEVTYDVMSGTTYVFDPSWQATPLHADVNYRVTFSADGGHALETYERDGRLFEATYNLRSGVSSPLRTDTTPGSD
jgi:hypothetical protein